ncbi:cytochrome c maturation protein CcmE [candidate division KSB1 bacterium]|nr:cytochrome c maturation protein CcmE [candidate division KSB1 bacterium]
MSGKKMKVAVSFAVVVVLLLWLIVSGFNENMQYYVKIKDLKAMPAEQFNKGLRVKGYLVSDSIEENQKSLEIFFTMEEDGEEMRVRYTKERPDTFKDGAEVIVEGHFTDAGYFDANMLMAKCPSKYESTDEYNTADYSDSANKEFDGTN